jgi:MarR family transcriptional regulator, organic hydroperoxide resistance regulator
MSTQVGTSRQPLPHLGPVLDFMRLVWAVDHALQKTSKRMKTAIGVTGPQRLVLRIVSRFPGITAGQIARLLHVHPGTLTGVLRRLEGQGLLHRRADPADRRRARLGVTEKGRQLEGLDHQTVEAAVGRVLATAPPDTVRAAKGLLVELAAALDPSGGAR